MSSLALCDGLADAGKRRGMQPFLTWFSEDGDRVEFSVTSIQNAVSKTAGFLQSECDAGPGSTIALDSGGSLPRHWQAVVFVLAAAQVGADVVVATPSAATPDADVAIFADLDAAQDSSAYDRVLVSQSPLGMPTVEVPDPLIDHARLVRNQPDIFGVDSDAAKQFSLTCQDRSYNQQGLVVALDAIAPQVPLSGARIAVATSIDVLPALVTLVVGPLMWETSSVWLKPNQPIPPAERATYLLG